MVFRFAIFSLACVAINGLSDLDLADDSSCDDAVLSLRQLRGQQFEAEDDAREMGGQTGRLVLLQWGRLARYLWQLLSHCHCLIQEPLRFER
eukprot:g1833.t1